MYSAYQPGQFSSRWPVRFSCSPWAASARRSALARSAADANVVSAASIRVRDGAWLPVLEGNATIVYRAGVDRDGRQTGQVEYAADENAAYASLDAQNIAHLKAAGVVTAHP